MLIWWENVKKIAVGDQIIYQEKQCPPPSPTAMSDGDAGFFIFSPGIYRDWFQWTKNSWMNREAFTTNSINTPTHYLVFGTARWDANKNEEDGLWLIMTSIDKSTWSFTIHREGQVYLSDHHLWVSLRSNNLSWYTSASNPNIIYMLWFSWHYASYNERNYMSSILVEINTNTLTFTRTVFQLNVARSKWAWQYSIEESAWYQALPLDKVVISDMTQVNDQDWIWIKLYAADYYHNRRNLYYQYRTP